VFKVPIVELAVWRQWGCGFLNKWCIGMNISLFLQSVVWVSPTARHAERNLRFFMKQQTFKIAFILFPFFLGCGNEKPNSDNKELKTAIQTESPLIEKEMITEPEILNSNLASF
jgi:hypothetical protein